MQNKKWINMKLKDQMNIPSPTSLHSNKAKKDNNYVIIMQMLWIMQMKFIKL